MRIECGSFLPSSSSEEPPNTQRLKQLQQAVRNAAIEEFLVVKQAKDATLAELEELDSLGKLIPQPAVVDR